MKLRVIAAGTRMPDWVTRGWEQYAARMAAECPLELREISLTRRGSGVSIKEACEQEGERMLAAVQRDERIVALQVSGQAWNTEELAGQLNRWRGDGRDIAFLIGGPDGLSAACLERADQQWSLSPLTFPHGLTRILVAEQLYRASTILRGHPYHRR